VLTETYVIFVPAWDGVGFVDGHTHPVWSGDRVHEFAMKLAGATYMDIHKKGGGIGFTVRHTKESSEEELRGLFIARLDRMLKFGTYVMQFALDAQRPYELMTPLCFQHTTRSKEWIWARTGYRTEDA